MIKYISFKFNFLKKDSPMSSFRPLLLPAMAVLGLSACSSETSTTASSSSTTIERNIMSANSEKLGTLTLKDLGMGGTAVTVSVSGISEGSHAMHFHETGLCEGPDFKSAGGHYNPTNRAHGKKMADGPHAGDMMNIMVDADLNGQVSFVNERVSINGDHGLPAIFDQDGTALILHEKADDYASQPSGAAGARIGCALLKG